MSEHHIQIRQIERGIHSQATAMSAPELAQLVRVQCIYMRVVYIPPTGIFSFLVFRCLKFLIILIVLRFFSSFLAFFFQAEDGIRDRSPSRGLGDVYKRQPVRYDTCDDIIHTDILAFVFP